VNIPLSLLNPPGRPVNKLLLSALVLGVVQSVVPVDFILPPATVVPPKKVLKVVHSSSVGMCHPVGANFFRKAVLVEEAAS
jgi:hypothetical protein